MTLRIVLIMIMVLILLIPTFYTASKPEAQGLKSKAEATRRATPRQAPRRQRSSRAKRTA